MRSVLADMLSSLRREKKINQRQAAQELGISQALLSHYENGVREPRLEFVSRACDYYGVTADYLIGRTSSRGDAPETGAAAELSRLSASLGDDRLAAELDRYVSLALARASDALSGGGESGALDAALALSLLRLHTAAEGRGLSTVPPEGCRAALDEIASLTQAR